MFNLKVTKTSTAAAVNRSITTLEKRQVYVGIPQENNERPDVNGKKPDVTNAELMYIHTNGSPLRNIPARPVIEPAIEADGNRQNIATELMHAAQRALVDDPAGMEEYLKRAGMVGMVAAKDWFTDPRNGWPPNKPSTIRNKLRTLRGKALNDALQILDEYESDPTRDVSGIDTPLIDTGELRRSITFVVGDDK